MQLRRLCAPPPSVYYSKETREIVKISVLQLGKLSKHLSRFCTWFVLLCQIEVPVAREALGC